MPRGGGDRAEAGRRQPAVSLFRNQFAEELKELGDVLCTLGRGADARGCYERTISLEEPEAQAIRRMRSFGLELACARRRCGLTRRDLGEPAAAAADTR